MFKSFYLVKDIKIQDTSLGDTEITVFGGILLLENTGNLTWK